MNTLPERRGVTGGLRVAALPGRRPGDKLVTLEGPAGVGLGERARQRHVTSDPLEPSDRGVAVSSRPEPTSSLTGGATESLRPSTPPDSDFFRCDVSRERDTAHIRPLGELDIATVRVLSAELARLREAGCRHVVFDLSDLAFMDSTGVCVFLERGAEALRDGFTSAVLPRPPAVPRVFERTGTTAHLPFVDSLTLPAGQQRRATAARCARPPEW